MRYETKSDANRVCNERDKKRIIDRLLREIKLIEKEIEEVNVIADNRIEYVDNALKNNEFSILGRTFKDGKNKKILLIIRLKDGSQFDERYSFNKISDMRVKMIELKEKYAGGNWDEFEEEIK